MDDWNGPKYVDFNSSERSYVDEDFFDASYKLRVSNGTQYDSCADSTNTSTNYGTPRTSAASCRTPAKCSRESFLDGDSSSAGSPAGIKTKKMGETKLSSTPNPFRYLKLGSHSANSSVSGAIQESDDTAEKKKNATTSVQIVVENADEECDKNNCTLVAEECENSDNPAAIIPEKLETEIKIEIIDARENLVIDPKSDKSVENELIMSPLKLLDGSIRDEDKREELPISSIAKIPSEIAASKDAESADEIISKISEAIDRAVSSDRSILDDEADEKISDEPSTDRAEKSRPEAMSSEERAKLDNLIDRLNPPKRRIVVKKNASSASSMARVLAPRGRRYSASKYRRRSNQYIGLAEAVAKFQFGTPERFRSKPINDKNAGPLPKRVKQTATKVTYAMSPVLLSKLRARAVVLPTSEKPAATTSQPAKKTLKKSSAESLVGKKILPNVPKSLPKASTSVEQKIAASRPKASTKPGSSNEPKASTHLSKSRAQSAAPVQPKNSTNLPKNRAASFASSQPKESTNLLKARAKSVASTERNASAPVPRVRTKSVTSTEVKAAREVPKAPETSRSQIETAMNPPTVPVDSIAAAISLSTKKTPMKLSTLGDSLVAGDKKKNLSRMSRTPGRKMVPSVVSVEDNDVVIKDVEVLHFGIPINTEYRNKNITRPIPFSFETRNMESKNKKDKLTDEKKESADEKTRKSIFHARPAPPSTKNTITTATAKTSSTVLKPKDDNASAARTLTFQERNELLIRKKKKFLDEIIEKEKKARIFHAKPAPNFKPVIVRRASAENLRSNGDDNNAARNSRSRGLSATRCKGLSQESLVSNQENKAPNAVPANQQCPKFKKPLGVQNLKMKKTADK